MTNKEIATEMWLKCLRSNLKKLELPISRMMIDLVQKGFVIVDEDDYIYITPKGEEEWTRLDSLKHMKVHNGH